MSSSAGVSPEGEAMIEQLMRFLPDGLTPNGWAVAAGVNRAVWGDIRSHGNPSRRTLEKLLAVAGSSLAEFEALRVGSPAASVSYAPQTFADRRAGWRPGRHPTMPCFDTVAIDPVPIGVTRVPAFILGQPRAKGVAVPPSLEAATEAFGFVLTVGNMHPRFRQGRIVIADPLRMPVIGDDVLVTLNDEPDGPGNACIVAELVWLNASAVRLRIYTPGSEFTLDRSRIKAVGWVAGEAL